MADTVASGAVRNGRVIQDRHPEIRSLAEVKAVLAKPRLIRRYDHAGGIRLYHRLAGRRPTRADDLYVAVLVGEDDCRSGSVRTAYLCPKMKSDGEILWIAR